MAELVQKAINEICQLGGAAISIIQKKSSMFLVYGDVKEKKLKPSVTVLNSMLINLVENMKPSPGCADETCLGELHVLESIVKCRHLMIITSDSDDFMCRVFFS